MKKTLIILLLFITTVGYGQIFETTLTQVDLYQGKNFETLVSSQSINYSFTLDNDKDRIIITQSNNNVFVYDITNEGLTNYENHEYLVMDLYDVTSNTNSTMIIIDRPLKTNTMQLLFNFDNNRSLIFDTNLILD